MPQKIERKTETKKDCDKKEIIKDNKIVTEEKNTKILGNFEVDDIILLAIILILLADDCDDKLLLLALAFVFISGIS